MRGDSEAEEAAAGRVASQLEQGSKAAGAVRWRQIELDLHHDDHFPTDATFYLGQNLYVQARYPEALKSLTEYFHAALASDVKENAVMAARYVASCFQRMHRYADAKEWFTICSAHAETQGAEVRAMIRIDLAGTLLAQGAPDEAANVAAEALRLATEAGGQQLARAHRVLGDIACENEDWPRADREYGAWLRILREGGEEGDLSVACLFAGVAKVQLGRCADAAPLLEESYAAAHREGSREIALEAAQYLAKAYGRLGADDEAIDAYGRCVDLAELEGMPSCVGWAAGNKATLMAKKNECRPAIAMFQRALRAARQVGDRTAEVFCLRMLGRCHLTLGSFAEAEETLRKAIDLARSLDAEATLAELVVDLLRLQRARSRTPTVA